MTTNIFMANKPFATSGVLARPAGLPCGALAAPPGYDTRFSVIDTQVRPSRPFGTAAVIAPSGWAAKEAGVAPTHANMAAGLDSVVDNTMRFKPLPPRYGKTREISPMETAPAIRTLAPDLLCSSKGLNPTSLPKVDHCGRMGAVLSQYSPSAALFAGQYDPERRTSGFLRTPGGLGGRNYVDAGSATTKMASTYMAQSPSADVGHTMKKFVFDRTANIAHIPVAKRVGTFPRGDFYGSQSM